MEQQVAIVKVQSLGRDDPWSSHVEVNATRPSSIFDSTVDITWYVTAIQTKDMFIGQEFEVTIKPYIREESTNAEWTESSNVYEEATKEAAEYSEGS